MIKTTLLGLLILFIAALLQSTIFSQLVLHIYAIPDFTLMILIFTAYINGFMVGQLSGFFSGLMLDFLSAAPVGMNALIRTLTGALTGLMKGAFFLDNFILPMVLCALATIFKAVLLYLLHLLFSEIIPYYSLLSPVFWVELGLNTIFAPFVFGLLKLCKPLTIGLKEKF